MTISLLHITDLYAKPGFISTIAVNRSISRVLVHTRVECNQRWADPIFLRNFASRKPGIKSPENEESLDQKVDISPTHLVCVVEEELFAASLWGVTIPTATAAEFF